MYSYKFDGQKFKDRMDISKENVELIEKIREYRKDALKMDELKIKNESLNEQIKELEEAIRILKLKTIDKNKLLEKILKLEKEKKKLILDLEKIRKAYTFIVTSSKDARNTVCGEISNHISKVQKEILICSPWITYIVEELSNLKKGRDNKTVRIKIITRLMAEDIKNGTTDLDKFRILKDNLGAEIKYNNNLHAKMVVVDNSVAILSSANLTKKGLFVNYETGVCIKDNQMVANIVHFFDDVWKESTPMTEESIELCMEGKKL